MRRPQQRPGLPSLTCTLSWQRLLFSASWGFPGDESVSLPGGLLFSSWPLPDPSLTQPQPPVLPLGSSLPQKWALSLGSSSAEAPKPASLAQPPPGSWSGFFSVCDAKPGHFCLCKGSGASGISVTTGQMCAHFLTL